MEAALPFLEHLFIASIGIFALYQCFLIPDTRRPIAGWTARAVLIVLAGVCFFTVARLIGTR